MTKTLRICVFALAAGLASLAGPATPGATAVPVWTEITWPFLIDQWGLGRAFACGAADCGAEIKVYLRPKLGFCNCTTGVSDDGEVDRVADIELLGASFSAAGEGRAITVGGMAGRARPYRFVRALAGAQGALAIAFSDQCNVMVATVIAEPDLIAAAETAALEFLNGNMILAWARNELGW